MQRTSLRHARSALAAAAARCSETASSASAAQSYLEPSGAALQGSLTVPVALRRSRVDAQPFQLLPSIAASSQQVREHATLFNPFGKAPAKTFSQRRLVGWAPDQLYRVVSEVEHYHTFVPWCQKSTIKKRSADGKYLEAELEVGFQMLVERYVSKVNLQAPRLVRSTVADSMLFHHLDSSWRMEPGPTPHTCWLTFEVDFAFNSVLYTHLADMFFSEVVKRMISAFEGRCQRLYGPSSLVRLPGKQPSGQRT